MSVDIKTVVVLIALPEEHAQFQDIFPVSGDVSSHTQVRLEHVSGREDVRLISVLSEQMGAQSALLSADNAINDFTPDMLVVVGIAGGLTPDLTVGDVCVSNEIIDVLQNTKISEKAGKVEIAFAPDFYVIDAELVSSFTFLKVHPGCASLLENWKDAGRTDDHAKPIESYIREGGPDFLIGPIACGPVVASSEFHEKLKLLHRKVAAIETESGGVFGRLTRLRLPAIAIRGISDLADSGKTNLEQQSRGAGRQLAMRNASRLLKSQILNERFMNVAVRFHSAHANSEGELFPTQKPELSLVSELDKTIRAKLAERSPEFRAKPDSFFLPIPRAQKVSYVDEIAGKEIDDPINLVDCLQQNKRIFIRLPRSYPSQALGWSLANTLIRQQIDGKIVLPYVIAGEELNPPAKGLSNALPAMMSSVIREGDYIKVIIIEEPLFHARNRVKFLTEELSKTEAYVMVITKTENTLSVANDFMKENAFQEYELSPISFAETAFFLEKAFDMSAREAEAVAIRLDDTFRRFKLEAHPTYFAGIQEETLDALINANKRAELIQLAVDAILSLMVAADKSIPPLSRTTRERFLRSLVLEMANDESPIDDKKLLEQATKFLNQGLLPTPPMDFLRPFFDIGLLYRSGGSIFVTHPYLESYLLAQALRENASIAQTYFDSSKSAFNYYAFDLYCEMGPSAEVIAHAMDTADHVLQGAGELYPAEHIFLDTTKKLTSMSSQGQIRALTTGLMKNAERLEKDESASSEVRAEKQRLLDARRYVRKQVGERNPEREQLSPLLEDIKAEFSCLDKLARALNLVTIAIGAGSESLSGDQKVRLGNLVLATAEKFSDVWTRNRLRIDFQSLRNDILSDDNVWQVVNDLGALSDDFEKVKADLNILLHGFELHTVLEPMSRVLWGLSSTAGVRVLAPVLLLTTAEGPLQELIKSSWLLDVDAEKGRDSFKVSLASYNGSPLMRLVLGGHILWRAFWHHYNAPGARHFINSARRALRPLSLIPSQEQLENIKKGPIS